MNVLVTGGAGFIGSTLAEALVSQGIATRVLDDLSTGYRENVPERADLLVADIADESAVRKAVDGVDVVFHQAAHRAVLKSIDDPVATDLANSHGTVTLLKAAVDAGVRRVVYASSSSVYGGAAQLPTPETAPTLPRSPYAVTKLTGEHYCRVFSDLFGLETISLRYFNVYGPRQRPDSAYAAVIPLFIDAARRGERPIIHGDGLQSRAFAYVSDVVEANLAAARAPSETARGQAYNIAGSQRHTVLDLLTLVGRVVGPLREPIHTDPRPGDVRHSFADLSAARVALGYEPRITLEEGLRSIASSLGASAA